MANPYYRSGAMLKAKNEQAAGAAVEVPEFALAQVRLDLVRTALDVGCGWGRFARPLARRGSIELTCIDVWAGMVESCRQTLAEVGLGAAGFLVGDARAIPVRTAAFDLVMANHMLYEFAGDDLRQVVAELSRVVARDGTLLATTYSDGLVPLTDLHNETLAAVGFPPPGPQPSTFCLENGAVVLSAGFGEVATHVMEEVRSDTDADALTALYLKTGGYHWAANHDPIPERNRAQIPEVFRSKAQQRIDREGAIVTLTKWTAFVAQDPV